MGARLGIAIEKISKRDENRKEPEGKQDLSSE
jgi:hypothetical protein